MYTVQIHRASGLSLALGLQKYLKTYLKYLILILGFSKLLFLTLKLFGVNVFIIIKFAPDRLHDTKPPIQ